jgi:hypothetical protein
MSAWTNLLAASSLNTGTAWDLLTHPRLGGGSILVHDAIGTINDISVSAVVNTDPIVAVANDTSISTIYSSDGAIAVYVPDAQSTAISCAFI